MKTHQEKRLRLPKKYRFQEQKNRLRMFFRPGTTILFCIFACLFLILLCFLTAFLLRNHLQDELFGMFTPKDLLFAMVTGVTASALVSICIEGASNYRENCRRYIILSDYLSAVFHYELEIRSYLKVAEENIEASEKAEASEKPDRLQAVSHQLPKLIPVLQNTMENKREFLSLKEAFEVQNILNTYEHYESVVYQHLLERMKPIRGTKRPKNMSKRAWDSMPESWQAHLSAEERFGEIRQLAHRLCQLGITGFENPEIPVGVSYLLHEIQAEEELGLDEEELRLKEEELELDSEKLKPDAEDLCPEEEKFCEESFGGEEAPADGEGESIWDEYDDCDRTAMEKLFLEYKSKMLSSLCLEIDQSMGRLLTLAKHEPGWGIYARAMEETPTPPS